MGNCNYKDDGVNAPANTKAANQNCAPSDGMKEVTGAMKSSSALGRISHEEEMAMKYEEDRQHFITRSSQAKIIGEEMAALVERRAKKHSKDRQHLKPAHETEKVTQVETDVATLSQERSPALYDSGEDCKEENLDKWLHWLFAQCNVCIDNDDSILTHGEIEPLVVLLFDKRPDIAKTYSNNVQKMAEDVIHTFDDDDNDCLDFTEFVHLMACKPWISLIPTQMHETLRHRCTKLGFDDDKRSGVKNT